MSSPVQIVSKGGGWRKGLHQEQVNSMDKLVEVWNLVNEGYTYTWKLGSAEPIWVATFNDHKFDFFITAGANMYADDDGLSMYHQW